MKKLLSLMLVSACLLGSLTGCAKKKDKEIVFAKDDLLAEYTYETDKEMEVIKEADGVKSVYFYRGEIKLYGQIYLPDKSGANPVVIITPGSGAGINTHKDLAKELAKNGYVAVLYDGYGAVSGSMSDGKTTEHTVLTHAADLESVIKALVKQPYIDKNNIFLWGHSAGGMVTGYVASRNPDIVEGMILVEPRFMLNEETREAFPDANSISEDVCPHGVGVCNYVDLLKFDIYDFLPNYKGEVLLFVGERSLTPEGDIPQEFAKTQEKLSNCRTFVVDGADHGFQGKPMMVVTEKTIEFVDDND